MLVGKNSLNLHGLINYSLIATLRNPLLSFVTLEVEIYQQIMF